MKPNKLLLLFLCVVTLVPHSRAQSVQRGIAMEYHEAGAKTPLSGVSVSAANAGSTMSDAQGQFTLNFRTLRAGDNIQFRRIERAGYEVMNREAIEVMRVGSRDNAEALQLVLCQSQLLRQLRDGYRTVAVRRYEQQLAQATREAEQLRAQGQMEADAYNARLDSLEAAYAEQLSHLDAYVDRFARIDLTALDQAERQIIALVQQGEFDEAMRLYDEQGFVQRLQQNRSEQRQLVQARDQLTAALEAQARETQRLRQSIERQVNLLYLAGGRENHDKAHAILRQVYEADPTDVEARRNYVTSLFNLGQSAEARQLLTEGIAQSQDPFARSNMAVDLATYCDVESDGEGCLRYAHLADSLARPLIDTDPRVRSRILPSAYQYLLQYSLDDPDRCRLLVAAIDRECQLDSFDIRSIRDICMLEDVIIRYLSLYSLHDDAVRRTEASIPLNQLLHDKSPWQSALDRCYESAAQIYQLEGYPDRARDAALSAIRLTEAKLDKAPLASQIIQSVSVYYTAVSVLESIDDTQAADQVIAQAQRRQVYTLAEQTGQDTFLQYASLFRFYEALAAMRRVEAETAEALIESAYQLALQTEDGATYADYQRYYTLGRLRQHQQRYTEAHAAYDEAIRVTRQAYLDEPDDWNADSYCNCLLQCADMLIQVGQPKASRKYLRQADKVAAFRSNRQRIEQLKGRLK